MVMIFLLCNTLLAAEGVPYAQVTPGFSVNRVGLNVSSRYGQRFALWEKPDSVLFSGTGIKVGGEWVQSPIYSRLGGRVVVSPLAVLDVSAYGYQLEVDNVNVVIAETQEEVWAAERIAENEFVYSKEQGYLSWNYNGDEEYGTQICEARPRALDDATGGADEGCGRGQTRDAGHRSSGYRDG